MQKSYDQLTIQDNFMFQKVMRNKRICKQTIERLLDIDIKDITYLEEEKSINVLSDSKGIRLDVYVNDEAGTVYNIEMQTTCDMRELIKRARYYQAMIDIHLIEKGKLYRELGNTFIIFICTFGIFAGNRHKYTFKNVCIEDYDILLNDGATKMFLSTKGTQDDIPGPLKVFLDYVDGKKPSDTLTTEIDKIVTTARNRTEWRREYMTLELEIERNRFEARAEGKAEGKVEGKIEIAISMWKKGKLTENEAAEEVGITLDEFRKAVSIMA